MAKCFVIGEAGSTHDGDLQKAIRLVYAAKDCGADAVKFQWVSSPERLAERRNAGEYVKHYRLISFDRSWFDVLYDKCQKAGIEFMCTAYLPEDIPVVAKYVKRFKVASFEAEDEEFVLAHAPFGKPTIISHGMGDRAYFLQPDGEDHHAHLHCVSAYPCPIDELNLSCITDEGYDGLSDHTTSTLTGALAVAAGASIIEKHIRLHDTDPKNADYAHSLVPRAAGSGGQCDCKDGVSDFEDYVANIREAERALGDGIKRIMPAEEPYMRFKVRP